MITKSGWGGGGGFQTSYYSHKVTSVTQTGVTTASRGSRVEPTTHHPPNAIKKSKRHIYYIWIFLFLKRNQISKILILTFPENFVRGKGVVGDGS